MFCNIKLLLKLSQGIDRYDYVTLVNITQDFVYYLYKSDFMYYCFKK